MKSVVYIIPAVTLWSADGVVAVDRDRCPDPVDASFNYLKGVVNYEGPCKTDSATDRFIRYSEWITDLGGWVNPKIFFRRGEYVDEVSGELEYSVGGVFLKRDEHISQGEVLIEVPASAHFCDKLILDHIPWFQKFTHMDLPRLWLSMGLAALIKYHPSALGPWAALLPDISYHPTLWSDEDKMEVYGTHAFSMLLWADHMSNTGCSEHEEKFRALKITCEEAKRAHAIIMSRSFGMTMNPGDSGVTIPLGFDFLNHNPNTKSGISRLDNNTSFFQMYSFTLPPSRELFNNYGPHTMSLNLVLYGFTSPDTKDELVIQATTDGVFDGEIHPLVPGEYCPRNDVGFTSPSLPECISSVHTNMVANGWDEYGNFRLSSHETIAMPFRNQWIGCPNRIDGPFWKYLEQHPVAHTQLEDFGEYVLPLGAVDGSLPRFEQTSMTYLAACALPPLVSGDVLKKFATDVSTCQKAKSSTLHPAIQHMAWSTMLRVCNHYEFTVWGGLKEQVQKWIAYRNVRIGLNRSAVPTKSITHLLDFSNKDEFYQLLQYVNSHKTVELSDNDIDQLTRTYRDLPVETIYKKEEIHKFMMQTVYLLERKCRNPIENVMAFPNFTSTINSYIYD